MASSGYASPDCEICDELFCHHRNNEENNMLICGLCEVGERAEGRCVQCEEYLCDGCIIRHLKLKVTANHEIIPLQNFQELCDDESIVKRQRSYSIRATKDQTDSMAACRKHRGEVKKFYCNECMETICRDCILTGHKNHRAVDLDDAAEDVRDDLLRVVNDVKLQRVHTFQDKDDLSEYKRHIDIKFGAISEMFRTIYHEMSTQLNESYSELNKKLSSIQEAEHQRIKFFCDDLDTKVEASDEVIDSMETVIRSSNNIEIIQSKESLKSRLYQHLLHLENSTELQKVEFFILKHPRSAKASSFNIIGDVSMAISGSPSSSADDNINELKPKRECIFSIWETRNNRPLIRGIAESDGHVWVVTSRSLVKISLDGFKRTNVQLTSNSDIVTIATGPSGKLLVAFNKGNTIKMYYKDTWSSFATVPDTISTLTTSRDGQRVLVSVGVNRGDTQKILAYTAEGKLKHHITIPYQLRSTKTSITCLTTNPMGNICLCDNINSRVLFCNQNLEIMHEYQGSGEQLAPKAVTFDSRGYTFVADASSKTVHLLTPDGTFLMTLLSSDIFQDIGVPVALAMDHKDRLWIGTDMGTICCFSY